MTVHLPMKAIQIQASGGPHCLQLQDIPKPVPTEGEVLVRVHAAGVNPWMPKFARASLRDFTRNSPRSSVVT